jgi:hypothetical protein
LFTKFAVAFSGLLLRNVSVTFVVTPRCIVAGTGSAIQSPIPVMLLQATLKASPDTV